MANTYLNKIEKIFLLSKNFNHAVDIGANVGEVTNLMSKKWKKVTAFEPAPSTFSALKENVDSNVNCKNFGLSNINGEINFATGPNPRINQIVSPGFYKKGWSVETIPVRTLDSFNLKDVDFLKIDVEGHERQVVLGAENTIKRCYPVIVIEISFEKKVFDKTISKDHAQALEILEQWGYRIINKFSHDYILIKE
jgi:FkbM family methyltransferase